MLLGAYADGDNLFPPLAEFIEAGTEHVLCYFNPYAWILFDVAVGQAFNKGQRGMGARQHLPRFGIENERFTRCRAAVDSKAKHPRI